MSNILTVIRGKSWVNRKYKVASMYAIIISAVIALLLSILDGVLFPQNTNWHSIIVAICGLILGCGMGMAYGLGIANDKGWLKE